MNDLGKLFLRDQRIDKVSVSIACFAAALVLLNVAVFSFCLASRGSTFVSDLYQQWTRWFPFVATFVVLAPIVFAENYKHLTLVAGSALVLIALTKLNTFLVIHVSSDHRVLG
ncbi:hypothetical protein [Rhodopirellula baltica]|uniref:Uncharacterized protein n=1 Tax=Rhodopirellula baltica WH47 TaxID=991778 RepID=F2AY37_RHOBT|nr:hypothetical protein [Rhodopirellula baltica]EGF25416.1 hypothetical protein RBWH47_02888 [Rhodopirellula baltica WH47]